jgi:TrmH family RNA methyltransferase
MQQSSPHQPITSNENNRVKHLRSLHDPKHRKSEKAFLIEGVKMVKEALRGSAVVSLVVAAPSLVRRHGKALLKLAEQKSCEILWVSEKLLDSLSESKTPQPVMAVVEMKEQNDEMLLNHPSGIIIIAHELQDPGNLGTLIRTCEAISASGIAITPHTVDPFNAKTVRASMGSILRLPMARTSDAASFIRKSKERGFQTVALALDGGTTHFDLDLRKPTAVLLGQEGSGLPDDLLRDMDQRVRIPMADTIDSLNVAVSAAVFLYELVRQRMKK